MSEIKKKLIKDILLSSNIHGNIRINFGKIPNYTEEDGFNWEHEASPLLESFVDDFKYEKINDTGNRNLCGCNKIICKKDDFKKNNKYNGRYYIDDKIGWKSYSEAKKLNLINKRTSENRDLFTEDGACLKHDLWGIYTHGRMGATLYWDKYWNSKNSGFYFKYEEYELEEMELSELKKILKEVLFFNEKVCGLMESFYLNCEYRLKELREEKIGGIL